MSKEMEYDNVLTKLLDNDQISQDDIDKIDQWKYVTVTYNTKEKIIDRLDYILRYY